MQEQMQEEMEKRQKLQERDKVAN